MSEMPFNHPRFLEVVEGLELIPANEVGMQLHEAYVTFDALVHLKSIEPRPHDDREAIELCMIFPGPQQPSQPKVVFERADPEQMQIRTRVWWGTHFAGNISQKHPPESVQRLFTVMTFMLREATVMLDTDKAWAKILARK